jgi:hypothetical protein
MSRELVVLLQLENSILSIDMEITVGIFCPKGKRGREYHAILHVGVMKNKKKHFFFIDLEVCQDMWFVVRYSWNARKGFLF